MLIASSNAENTRVIEETARAWSLAPVVCSTVEDVQRHMVKHDVALVFCQDRLPTGDYQELIKAAPRGTRKIPVIVVISDADCDDAFRRAMQGGAFDVIASPCSRQDVQWIIIRAVGAMLPQRSGARMI